MTALAFDTSSNRLLVATRGGVVMSLRADGPTPELIFSVQISVTPIAVAHGNFGNSNSDVRSVLVFDQIGGKM